MSLQTQKKTRIHNVSREKRKHSCGFRTSHRYTTIVGKGEVDLEARIFPYLYSSTTHNFHATFFFLPRSLYTKILMKKRQQAVILRLPLVKNTFKFWNILIILNIISQYWNFKMLTADIWVGFFLILQAHFWLKEIFTLRLRTS